VRNKEQSEICKCIYCLTENTKLSFNKEHVLHKSFGKFQKALSLTREVCKNCNAYFGDNIDRVLGRDSFEAILRLRYGIKPSKEYSDIPYNRLTITVPEGNGDWTGVKVVYLPPSVHMLPQLGFPRKGTGDYIYFTLPEVEKGIQVDNFDVKNGSKVKIIANAKDEYEKLISFLRKSNIPMGTEREFSPVKLDDGKLNVKVEFIIDTILARGIAKIGFNYMAKMCGSTFACKDDFNRIRQFIRYEKLPPGELRETIEPSRQPLLANDDFNRRRFGHILLVEWDITRRHVLARVSLFNSIAWTIILARDVSGIFREIKSCHFYDIQHRVVKQWQVFSRELVP
jgi:hypothetical protein